MTSIFVSHAVADRVLAELLVDFLMDGIGVPKDEIFCSSIDGHGNPLTYDFNINMRQQIQDPKLVILMMTPAYMDSQFCLMELGATWALSLKPLPIVVPPVSFADVTRTIGQVQGWNINNSDLLQQVRETVTKTLDIPGRDNMTFDRKRRRWEVDLPRVLEGLAPSTKAPRAELDEAMKRTAELQEAISAISAENEALTARLESRQDLRPVALIVEGDPTSADKLSSLLEELGFLVCGVARTQTEAESLARLKQPDLITMETSLSDGTSGIDAANAILEHSDASIVFVTSYPERLLVGNRPEPVHLVTKPFDDDTVSSTIRMAYEDLTTARRTRPRSPPHQTLGGKIRNHARPKERSRSVY